MPCFRQNQKENKVNRIKFWTQIFFQTDRTSIYFLQKKTQHFIRCSISDQRGHNVNWPFSVKKVVKRLIKFLNITMYSPHRSEKMPADGVQDLLGIIHPKQNTVFARYKWFVYITVNLYKFRHVWVNQVKCENDIINKFSFVFPASNMVNGLWFIH